MDNFNTGYTFTGNDSDNNISALGGDDTVFGLLGDDNIRGGDGNDYLRGDDTSRGDGGDQPGGNDVIFGENGDDRLDGRSGNDILSGGSGNDDIKGGAGNDILIGGSGNDMLRGDVRNVEDSSRGNDTFVLAEGDGTDTILDFQDGIDKIALQGNLTFDELTISQRRSKTVVGITATGEQLAILKDFNPSNLSADDFIEGFLDINEINIESADAGYIFTGNDSDNNISALGGDDTVFGLLGDDDIKGGDGNDYLRGDDTSRGDGGDQPGGNDVIFGENGDDRLDGRSGNDVLLGGADHDNIKGGAGDDILIGGSGNDLLRGDVRNVEDSSRGNDTFVLAEGNGTDTILDFQDGIDKIALQGNLTFDELTISQRRSKTVVGITATGEQLAILKDFNPSNLSVDDFIEGFADINDTDNARALF